MPFERATTLTHNGIVISAPGEELIFINSRYKVNARCYRDIKPFGRIIWLSKKRKDKRFYMIGVIYGALRMK